MNKLDNWLIENDICYKKVNNDIYEIDSKNYFYINRENNKDYKLFDSDFTFCLTEDELDKLEIYNSEYAIFDFGYFFYYSSFYEPKLNILRNLGKSTNYSENDIPYVGIHTGFEILSSIGTTKNIVNKAKFLGYKTIAVCDNNSLASCFSLESECQKNNIKLIIGISIQVNEYWIKLFVKDEIGWINICNINALINVKHKGITLKDLEKYSEGLICVLAENYDFTDTHNYMNIYSQNDLYFGIDLSEYENIDRDNFQINRIKHFYEKYSNNIKPILCQDTTYIEKGDDFVLTFVNKVGKINKYPSKDRFFKPENYLIERFIQLFNNDDNCANAIMPIINNTIEFAERCNYQIDKKTRKLPKYEFGNDEKLLFETNEDLFWSLIDKSLNEKIINKGKDVNVYIERIEKEFSVIDKAGVTDYFLIFYDFVKYCAENNILTGFGRGSAAGSLISYLFDIVKIDPIEYNLLFERFLNEGRAMTTLPDIDLDIQDDKRDESRKYLKEKYGEYRISQVGNYSLYKVKSALSDICKELNIEFQDVKLITSIIDKDTAEGDFTDLIKCVLKENKLKSFISKIPEMQIYFETIIGNPRSMGIHASATIISPKDDLHQTFFDWCPVVKNGDFLVSQWQGKEMEDAGYLKCDFLGLSQLTKFSKILELLKNSDKVIPNIYDLNLKDKEAFRYFENGWNEDVFQFGSPSQKKYSRQLKPNSVFELSLANALYRPGPMESGAHNKLVEIKFGKRGIEYDPLLKHIVENTFGLWAYQEQVMQAYQYITNANLNEADDFRKYITKMKGGDWKSDERYVGYMNKFLNGYSNKGINLKDAENTWNKIVAFAGYAFNRSHSDSYAITGYIAQYLKVNYPLEFYTVSLQTVKSDIDVVNIINEINLTASIKLEPPNINYSAIGFQTNGIDTIYWSLSSIFQCGEKTILELIDERNKNGKYYSFEEFLKRCSKIVDKRVICNFIYSGCFDEIEKINHPSKRNYLLLKYDEFRNFKEVDKVSYKMEGIYISDYFWQLKMKQMCNFDKINWLNITKYTNNKFKNKLLLANQIDDYEPIRGEQIIIGGIILETFERNTKTKKKIFSILLEQNNLQFNCVIWDDKYKEYEEELNKKIKGKILVLSGQCSYDTFRQQNSIYSSDKTVLEIL
jgi:DNA polymerase-3 subunit alpha